MIRRKIVDDLLEDLREYPAAGLLGPRQVGKTTVARSLDEAAVGRPVEYLDLQSPAARVRLGDPEGYLAERAERLVILDEVQLMPELFSVLRSVIDEDRSPGRFLLLGSASPTLLRGSSESLAGRISYNELPPLSLPEVADEGITRRDHWVAGGFPVPLLQLSRPERRSRWYDNLVASFVSRDLAELGHAADATELARLLSMVATSQGGLLNRQSLSRSLTGGGQTVDRYLNLLERGFLVRRLRPWLPNLTKRLVKSPRVYVRDSGLLHALLGIETYDRLRGHHLVGASYEGYVVEEIARALRGRGRLYFYRTAAGAELDLVVELRGAVYAFEIKRSTAPTLTKGFWQAVADVRPRRTFVVVPEGQPADLKPNVRLLGLAHVLAEIGGWVG